MMNGYRLRGRIEPGTFPNERIVVVRDHAGVDYAVIVDASVVQDDAINVKVLDRTEHVSLVRLPGEPLESGRFLSVRNEKLETV